MVRLDHAEQYVVGCTEWAKTPGTIADLIFLSEKTRSATAQGGTWETVNPFRKLLQPLPPPKEFRYFDWAQDELEPRTAVVAVPEPGVVFAVFGDAIHDESIYAYLVKIRQLALQKKEMQDFLQSPEARFKPLAVAQFDVFLSYAAEDSELAAEIHSRLTALELRVFMAEKSLGFGRWEPKLRTALKGCAVVALVLTPNSKDSSWVLMEAGAAWVLDKPIAIAAAYVGVESLPGALPAYQCRPFVTDADRDAFIARLFDAVSEHRRDGYVFLPDDK